MKATLCSILLGATLAAGMPHNRQIDTPGVAMEPQQAGPMTGPATGPAPASATDATQQPAVAVDAALPVLAPADASATVDYTLTSASNGNKAVRLTVVNMSQSKVTGQTDYTTKYPVTPSGAIDISSYGQQAWQAKNATAPGTDLLAVEITQYPFHGQQTYQGSDYMCVVTVYGYGNGGVSCSSMNYPPGPNEPEFHVGTPAISVGTCYDINYGGYKYGSLCLNKDSSSYREFTYKIYTP